MLAGHVGRIDAARNGIEAVEAVKAADYDVVLMDIAMPEMDGIEAARLIRGLPPPKGEVPIIAMTAHVMAGDRDRCLAVGMDDYLTKPVERGRLLATIEHWLAAGASPRASRMDRMDTQGDMPAAPHASPARGAAVETSIGKADTPSETGIADAAAIAGIIDAPTIDRLEADTSPGAVQDLVKTFILETVERLDNILALIRKDDLATLEREAHSLKSSAGTFGAVALAERARALEAACKEGDRKNAAALAGGLRDLAIGAAEALVAHVEARAATPREGQRVAGVGGLRR